MNKEEEEEGRETGGYGGIEICKKRKTLQVEFIQ
jgi:hypothetical protein